MPLICGIDHLDQLLRDFEVCCNECRRHTKLGEAIPSIIHRGGQWKKPDRSARTLPANLERRVFPDTQITAYRRAA